MRSKQKNDDSERDADELRRAQRLLEQLGRYVDHDEYFEAVTTKDLPDMFQVTVDGRVCCAVLVNWDAIRDVARDAIRRDFESLGKKVEPLPTVSEDGERLRPIDHRLLAYVLPFLPEKLDAALGQLINEAVLKAMSEATKDRGLEIPLARFADNVLKSETQRVRQRLGVRRGAPKGAKKSVAAKFSRQTFEATLKNAIQELSRGSDDAPTRQAVAQRLGVGSARTLDRLIRLSLPGKSWRDVLAEM